MKSILFYISFTLFAVPVLAQQQEFKVELSSDSVLLGNYVEVSFIALNIDGDFQVPEFQGMKLVGGPNQSSSMSSINGDVKKQTNYSYFLEPIEVGEYFIPPASLKAETQVWETEPIKLYVLDNPEGIIQNPSQSKQFYFEFGDLFDSDLKLFKDQDLLKDKEELSKPKVKRRKI